MPRDSLKWRVNEAVQNSALPPPARLIMLVLSDMADSNTGEIPAKKTPSVTELARRTGLTETTVKTHRAALERQGWIVILRPTAAEAARHVPSRYRIAIGQDPTGGQETTPGEVQSAGRETTPETNPRGSGGDPRNVDRGSGDDYRGGQETTTAGVRRRPPSYYYDRNDHNDQLLRADARDDEGSTALFDMPPAGAKNERAAKPRNSKRKQSAEPKPRPLADEVTDEFWAKHGKGQAQSWVAIRAVLRTCLANEIPRADLAAALDLLAADQTSISGGTVQNALKRLKQAQGATVVPFQRNGHTAFRDDPNRDYSLAAYLRERNGA